MSFPVVTYNPFPAFSFILVQCLWWLLHIFFIYLLSFFQIYSTWRNIDKMPTLLSSAFGLNFRGAEVLKPHCSSYTLLSRSIVMTFYISIVLVCYCCGSSSTTSCLLMTLSKCVKVQPLVIGSNVSAIEVIVGITTVTLRSHQSTEVFGRSRTFATNVAYSCFSTEETLLIVVLCFLVISLPSLILLVWFSWWCS